MDQPTGPRPTNGFRGSLAPAIVDAIADREGVAATDLERPLYDAVDPDALETLFRVDAEGRPRCRGHVTFAYGAHTVTVTSDGEVEVGSSPSAGPSASGVSGGGAHPPSRGDR